MFGYDTDFVTNAATLALSKKKIENVASGRIVLGGELPLRPVFANDWMWAYRTDTRKGAGQTYLTVLKWEKWGTRVLKEWDLTAAETANTATSMVSVGTDGVVI